METAELLLYQNLSPEEIRRSMECSRMHTSSYSRNQIIFQQGDPADYLYVIRSGTVLLEQTSPVGRQTCLELLYENQCFGEIDVMQGGASYRCCAIAKTDVSLICISGSFFKGPCMRACTHHHQLIRNLMQIFAARIELEAQKIYLLSFGTLSQRIALYVKQLSQGRSRIQLPLNREELAAYLNTARPSLSRELAAMQKRGSIRLEGRSGLVITDRDLLEREIEGAV